MSYYIQQRFCKIFISSSAKVACLSEIKDLIVAIIADRSKYKALWCNPPEKVLEADSLEAALELCGWTTQVDESGNIVSIGFIGTKYLDYRPLFVSFASFVKNGSYIEMEGESGERWRWIFYDNNVIVDDAILIWRSDLMIACLE